MGTCQSTYAAPNTTTLVCPGPSCNTHSSYKPPFLIPFAHRGMKPIVLLLRDADQIVKRIVHPIKVFVVYDHAVRHGVHAREEQVYCDMFAHPFAVVTARLVLHFTIPFLSLRKTTILTCCFNEPCSSCINSLSSLQVHESVISAKGTGLVQ